MAENKGKTNTKKDLDKNKTFQEELKQTLLKIKQYKLSCEANIVSIFWKNPNLLYEHDNIKLDDFSENAWKVYWQIAYDIIIVEGKNTLDEITVGLYLGKHEKLKAKFLEYGGMTKIQQAIDYVDENNLDGYVKELYKWNVVMKLASKGFPVNDRLSDFADMDILDIYDEYEINLNHVFANADVSIKSYDISDGIDELIDKLDEGEAVGLAYNYLPLLNAELGGIHLGDVSLIGGVSNAGKSTFIRIAVLSSILDNKENIVVFLNEEGLAKWQREMLVWVANTVYKKDLTKFQVRNGKYEPEFKQFLLKCAQYLKDMKEQHRITVVPLERYSTATTVKLIKKYATMGIKYFVIDTFKMDNTDGSSVNDNTRLQMVQNMTNLYNTVKESCKNVALICTVQLTKASNKVRYLTMDAIGESKNIIDPCATALLIRNIFDDEYPGKQKELKVYKPNFDNKFKNNIPVQLDPTKRYQIIFVVKSRESSAGMGSHQFVVEVDYSRNIMKEVGFTNVTPDF